MFLGKLKYKSKGSSCRKKWNPMLKIVDRIHFICLYTDIKSLGNEQKKLEILTEEKLDIIGMTENWWGNSNDENADTSGYNLLMKNRVKDGGRGWHSLKQTMVSWT